MKSKLVKTLSLFTIGGLTYITIEIVWRCIMNSHPTHWTMFLLGGLAFVLIGGINEYFPWTMPFWTQDLIGTGIVLLAEFIFGCVLNLWLGLGVWDYSDTPFNICSPVNAADLAVVTASAAPAAKPATPVVNTTIEAGDTVKIVGTKYYSGAKIPDWVKAKNWIVLETKGDRVVVDKSADGKNAICSPIKRSDLQLVKKK